VVVVVGTEDVDGRPGVSSAERAEGASKADVVMASDPITTA
jgi:hypothetical protein